MKTQLFSFSPLITSNAIIQHRRFTISLILLLLTGILAFVPNLSFGQHHTVFIPKDGSIFLNPEHGNNSNMGTKESPLQTMYEAARRVNGANGKGSITIYLSEGIYGLDATVTFHPANWHFTKTERLTIRAQILPDAAEWNQAKMPVIVSTMPLNFKPGGSFLWDSD